jgi:hypothetical protein
MINAQMWLHILMRYRADTAICVPVTNSWRTIMLGFRSAVQYGLAAIVAIVVAGLPAPSQAQTGSVAFEISKAGFIVGVGGGRGVLNYQGRRYPLTVSGLGVGATIGASKTQLVGKASNLRQPSDIEGVYSALGGGVAIAGGVAGVRLQNAKGVVLDLQGRKAGLELSVGVSGAEIKMAR